MRDCPLSLFLQGRLPLAAVGGPSTGTRKTAVLAFNRPGPVLHQHSMFLVVRSVSISVNAGRFAVWPNPLHAADFFLSLP